RRRCCRAVGEVALRQRGLDVGRRVRSGLERPRVAAAATGLRTGATPRARRDQERRGGERGENEGGGSTHHCTGMGTSQTSKPGAGGAMWWTSALVRAGGVSRAMAQLEAIGSTLAATLSRAVA